MIVCSYILLQDTNKRIGFLFEIPINNKVSFKIKQRHRIVIDGFLIILYYYIIKHYNIKHKENDIKTSFHKKFLSVLSLNVF